MCTWRFEVKKIKIGKSNIEVSLIALGTIGFGMHNSTVRTADEAYAVVKECLDREINYIDTAPVYGVSNSEKLLGEALKNIPRDKVVLQTKCGLNWRGTGGEFEYNRMGIDVYRDLSPKAIREDLEESLKRLQTDYIDIYITHRQQVLVPLEDTIEELIRLKEEGKIRAIGASNLTAKEMETYCKSGCIDLIQQRFSILDQDARITHMPLCEKYTVTFQGWGILEHGILSGTIPYDSGSKYVKGAPVSIIDAWRIPEVLPYVKEFINGWNDLVEKYNCSFTNLVQACTLRYFDNQSLLIGMKNRDHIDDAINVINMEIKEEDFKRMEQDIAKLKRYEPDNVIKPFR